jgi:hypothetical protein
MAKSKEELGKEREGFEVQKGEALKLLSDRHSADIKQYEFRISAQNTDVEKWRAERAAKEKEFMALVVEKEKSLTAAENQMIDLATSHKQLQDELESVKFAFMNERQFSSKVVVNWNWIELTAESSVKGNCAELGGTARHIERRKD